MDLNKDYYRALMFILTHDNHISKGAIVSHFFGSNFSTHTLLAEMEEKGMIKIDNNYVSLTEYCKTNIEEIETKELDLMYKSIFENYDFALIQFLYNRGYAINIDDFPELLKTSAPQHGNAINDGNLIHLLFRFKNFINEEYHCYSLTMAGKKYYENIIEKNNENKPKPVLVKTLMDVAIDFKRRELETYGDFKSAPLAERLPAEKPQNQPNNVDVAPQVNIIKKNWAWLMNNPMSATIIGGIIALVIGTIILKHFHLI